MDACRTPIFMAATVSFGLVLVGYAPAQAQCSPQQVLKLKAIDSMPGDRFGASVDVSGDTAIIGANFDDHGLLDNGSAYIYQRIAGTWQQIAKLTAADGEAVDNFGRAVAIDGVTAVIGAPNDDDNGESSGSAYIFRQIEDTWQQVAKLTASQPVQSDFFGLEVDLQGDTAVVGALGEAGQGNGAVYVFREVGGVWQQVARIAPTDTGYSPAFGASLALDGNTRVAGDFNQGGFQTGAAYIFREIGGTWQTVAKLTNPQEDWWDAFGWDVALSGDTALISALQGGEGNFDDYGAVYVYREIGGVWQQITELSATQIAANDYYGGTLALSGNTAVIGAYYHNFTYPSSSGQAYIFREIGGVWQQIASVGPPNPIAFGNSIALDGNTAIVGDHWDPQWGPETGAAYFYDLMCPPFDDCNANGTPDQDELAGNDCNIDGVPDDCRSAIDDCNSNGYLDECEGQYDQLAKLTMADASALANFGHSVAVHGSAAVVVANPLGTIDDTAYFYEKTGGNWTLVAQLSASGAAAIRADTAIVGSTVFRKMEGSWQQIATLTAPGDVSGGVAFDGVTAVVGANVFREIAGTWQHVATLEPDDLATADFFGDAVAVHLDMIAVASPHDDDAGSSSGSVYLFQETGGTWLQVAKLTAEDAGPNDFFGTSLSLSADTILVGAFGSSDAGYKSGSAYIFQGAGSAWQQVAKLTANDATEEAEFGRSVTLSGDTAIIGAPREKLGSYFAGSAYVCREFGGTWQQIAKLTTEPLLSYHNFGWSVATDGDTTFIGDYFFDADFTDIGAAFVYDLSCPPMDDCNENGIPDGDELGGNDCNTNGIPDECEPQAITQVKSCRSHGPAGEFCLPLGDFGREIRSPGASQLDVVLTGSACQITAATVTCTSVPYSGSATVAPQDSNVVRVTLSTPLPDNDCCQLVLYGLDEYTVQVRTLAGDADGNGIINGADLTAIKPHLGHPAGLDNFLLDVDANGFINGADITAIKPRIGNTAAACP